ncbi:MAG: TRAM domain-containing protein, partial [Bacteroidota bacterium]
MYAYSERPGTMAARKYADDIAAEDKSRRLQELIDLQNSISIEKNKRYIGTEQIVLVEGESKKSEADLKGRNDQNVTVIFPKQNGIGKGSFVKVKIERSTQTSLIGNVVVVL